MHRGLAGLAEGLESLARQDLRRTRRVFDSPQGARLREGGRELVNFSSNDYLGLANDVRLRDAAHRAIDAFGVGAGASPLVSGHLRIHHDAEEAFAAFTRLPRAVLFPSGYAANLGVLGALADRHAEVFGDKLNHACLHDGAALSGAKYTRYAHGDTQALAGRLAASQAAVKIVATDAVFSMDGDPAPLPGILALCEAHDAWLLVDDAHGIGVLGEGGRGSLAHFGLASPRILYMATLGKALGGYGAFVAGEPEVVDWLVQRARTLIYSTALPPVAAAAAQCALAILENDPAPLASLHSRIREFHAHAARAGLPASLSPTAIQPVLLGDAKRALRAASSLREAGFLVPAIRPPTVPSGTSRLRISLSAAHGADDVAALVDALGRALAA